MKLYLDFLKHLKLTSFYSVESMKYIEKLELISIIYSIIILSVLMTVLLKQFRNWIFKDSATCLPNRKSFIREVCRKGLSEEKSVGIFIDVNDFKEINDTYGYSIGNQTIKRLAREMERAFNKHKLYRVSEDRFYVDIDSGDLEETEKLSNLFQNRVRALDILPGKYFEITLNMKTTEIKKSKDIKRFIDGLDLMVVGLKKSKSRLLDVS